MLCRPPGCCCPVGIRSGALAECLSSFVHRGLLAAIRDLTPCPVVPQLGGIAEPAVILATLALLIVTPAGTAAFWLVAGALAALVTVQVIFWTKTQPANSLWLEETELSRSATHFFETGRGSAPRDWTAARDQGERSRILRALAATLGLFLLTLAVAL